jgi:hypothetical protein
MENHFWISAKGIGSEKETRDLLDSAASRAKRAAGGKGRRGGHAMTKRKKTGGLIFGPVIFASGGFMRPFRTIAGIVLIMAAALSAGSGSAQMSGDSLQAIRDLYARTQERIALAVKEAEGLSPSGFYSNQIWINRRNGSWRATGNYYKKTTFWYADQPEFAVRDGKNGDSVLVKAEIDEGAAVRSFSREFLFSDGRLVFVFIRTREGDGPLEETRLYFRDEKLFRFQVGAKVVDVLKEAAEIRKQFLATF